MKIFVSDIQFLAFHGVTEMERSLGHRFRVDLVADVDETASTTDRLNDTVDYSKMAALAVELCNKDASRTVEHACERIGHGLLGEFPLMREVTVRLSKLQPAISINVESVGVEMLYTRAG